MKQHCNKCGKLTSHNHLGFLDGASHFTCMDCCTHPQCVEQKKLGMRSYNESTHRFETKEESA